jgi:hypothetical protein
MLTPAYIPLDQGPNPDLYGAVYDFVSAYARPVLAPDNIYRDMQNRAALPAGSNEYAVIALLGTVRRGTNVEELVVSGAEESEPERWEVRTLYDALVQVDFVSDSDAARQRAYTIESLTRSGVGVAFFAAYGITAHYADDVRELNVQDESKQFVHRYMTTLHLSYWSGADAGTAWFDAVLTGRIEDVDVHHPAT